MYATATHKEIHVGKNAMTPETETVPNSELLPVGPYFPLSVHKLFAFYAQTTIPKTL